MEHCFPKRGTPTDPLLFCCCSGSADPPQPLRTSENPYPHPTETAFQPHLSGPTCSGQMLFRRQEITHSLSHRLPAPANTFWSQHTNTHHKQLSPSWASPTCHARVWSSRDVRLLLRDMQSGWLSRTHPSPSLTRYQPLPTPCPGLSSQKAGGQAVPGPNPPPDVVLPRSFPYGLPG